MKAEQLKVLGIYQDPKINSCTLHRLILPFNYARKAGLDWAWVRLEEISKVDVNSYDLVVMQRLVFHKEYLDSDMGQIADQIPQPIVYEVDDDIFNIPESNPAYIAYEEQRQALERFLPHVAAVTTTVDHLAQQIRYRSNGPVWTLPNCVDPKMWTQPALSRAFLEIPDDAIIIGTQGSHTHAEDWKIVLPALERIAEKYPQVHFLFAGFMPEYMKELPRVHYATWRDIMQYPEVVKAFDIGLCPLPDTNFNKSKSPLKAIEFMAGGVPYVASPTVYSKITRDAGFIARTDEDWFQYIEKLVKSKSLRKKLGEAGRAQVKAVHNIQKEWPRWLQAYHLVYEAAKKNEIITSR